MDSKSDLKYIPFLSLFDKNSEQSFLSELGHTSKTIRGKQEENEKANISDVGFFFSTILLEIS